MKRAILIISHGSREISANREFVRLVGRYRKQHPGWKISHAFLELTQPSILEALEKMTKADEILVLPLFLFSARHVKEHIPKILAAFKKNHHKIKMKMAKPLGADPLLLDLLDARLRHISPK